MADGVRFLLLVAVCVQHPSAARPFAVDGAQNVYEAEEQSNVTLTRRFPPDLNGPRHLNLMRSQTRTSIFRYDSDSEVGPFVDQGYTGRLWCSWHVRGQVDCSITDLKLGDSDTYQFIIAIGDKSGSGSCNLTVSAIQRQPEDEEPKPEHRNRIGLYAAVGLFAVVILFLLVYGFTQMISHGQSTKLTNARLMA